MDRFDDDTLLAELRELRPTPRPDFTAELDERAAAGFPRRDSRASANPFARLVDLLRGLTPRRALVPVVGLSIAVLAAAIVVVAVSNNGGAGNDLMTSAMSEESGGGGEFLQSESEESAGAEARATPPAKAHAQSKAREGGFNGNFFDESGKSAGAKEAEGTMHSGEEAVESEPEEESGGAEIEEESAEAGEAEAVTPVLPAPSPARGHRDIERSASIVLGTKPGEVAGAAAKVYSAVHAANGVVLNSSVESGRTGPTGASFSLLIPSRKLDDALAEFSKIAEVRSRHDATNDITAPTIGVTEELRDSNASIEGLLKELGSVETEAERESVEARLREERHHHAAIRASLEHLHKRASMSEVSLRIVTNHGAGVVPPSKDDSGWSVGDALHDAGHILTVAAGVLLIALAILAPIALIALLLWSVNRFRVRRLRERALG
jgi:hypothetical protein